MKLFEHICRWTVAIGLLANTLALLAATGYLPGNMLISGPAPMGSADPYMLSHMGAWFFGGGVVLWVLGFCAWAWARSKQLEAEGSSD